MYKHILFDLDGTLTDPFRGITRAVCYSLEKFGIHTEPSEHRRFIGPPLYDSYREYYGFDDAQAHEAIKYYRELYNDGDALFDCRVYDGIFELLGELRERGCELILATSKPTVTALKVLDKFELRGYFDYVFGCELDGRRIHKDEVIAYALEVHPIELASAIMVGDRLHDIDGAHKNGLPAIGVLWGYGDRAELDEYGAEFVAADIAELRKLLIQ